MLIILEKSKKIWCYIVEDACHAFGASYFVNKKKFKIDRVSFRYINIFHPVKSITNL